MDFEDTPSALQGFIGKVVSVGACGPSDPPTGDLE
jgi:hypothetical protein